MPNKRWKIVRADDRNDKIVLIHNQDSDTHRLGDALHEHMKDLPVGCSIIITRLPDEQVELLTQQELYASLNGYESN